MNIMVRVFFRALSVRSCEVNADPYVDGPAVTEIFGKGGFLYYLEVLKDDSSGFLALCILKVQDAGFAVLDVGNAGHCRPIL
mmetsp:Transcript_47360/g.34661  ORF Transcript_47360/g.34661 Transcript_47360/m.34661 type:complete len:82 (+) Transcript_47360:865-1110(+)